MEHGDPLVGQIFQCLDSNVDHDLSTKDSTEGGSISRSVLH